MKIETKYDIGQSIFIPQINVKGKVHNIYISRNSIEYNIRYFISDKPETCYFLEDEICNDDSKKIGFPLDNKEKVE